MDASSINELYQDLAYHTLEKNTGINWIKDHHTDKCPVCLEPWQDLRKITGQRRWNVSDNCNHCVCTSCFWNMTNEYSTLAANIDDGKTTFEAIHPEDPLIYKLKRNITCPCCRKETVLRFKNIMVLNKWAYLELLNYQAFNIREITKERDQRIMSKICDGLRQTCEELENKVAELGGFELDEAKKQIEILKRKIELEEEHNDFIEAENSRLRRIANYHANLTKQMMSAIATQKQNHQSEKEAWQEEMKILHTISKRNEEGVTKRREQICAYTEQIVNEALKTRVKQEINDTSIEMMLSTFLDKTLNCLKAENVLPDSLTKELENILSPQLSEDLYQGARMLFANGMKDLAINNNIKLLLD